MKLQFSMTCHLATCDHLGNNEFLIQSLGNKKRDTVGLGIIFPLNQDIPHKPYVATTSLYSKCLFFSLSWLQVNTVPIWVCFCQILKIDNDSQ